MNGNASSFAQNAVGLRERNVPVRAQTENDARKAVLELNALEERTQKDEHSRKTYGRTPDGIGQYTLELSGTVHLVFLLMPIYLSHPSHLRR
jgi:hypothetical protein